MTVVTVVLAPITLVLVQKVKTAVLLEVILVVRVLMVTKHRLDLTDVISTTTEVAEVVVLSTALTVLMLLELVVQLV